MLHYGIYATDFHQIQKFLRARLKVLGITSVSKRLGKLRFNSKNRVWASKRALRYVANRLAAQLLPVRLRGRSKALTFEDHIAREDFSATTLKRSNHRATDHRLTGAGLTDDANHLTVIDIEICIVDDD